jgi:hypothetical protein
MPIRSGGREDYVLRIIRQAAEALRLLRLRLSSGADAPVVVRRRATAAVEALLGADAPLLARLDARSAVRLVGDPRRVALWHGLLDVAAAAAREGGDAAGSHAIRQRAAALAAAAAAEWGDAAASASAAAEAAAGEDGGPNGEAGRARGEVAGP